MKKQFVTYEIALKLKELGFDEECINEYWFTCKKLRFSFESIKNIYHYKRSNSDNNDISLISAPLWQQVIDWFREKHNLWIQIEMEYYDGITYNYVIIQNNGKVIKFEDEFHEYYEAREQAILKAIELCQKEK